MADHGRSFNELRSSGLLWLINRQVFNPYGLALNLHMDDDGNAVGWSLIGDGEEPIFIPPELEKERFDSVKAEFGRQTGNSIPF